MFERRKTAKLDRLFQDLHVQPVGNGYIDCICPMDHVPDFIRSISDLGIRITKFTWWCYVSEGHEPCGMGGPINKFGPGWYSEIEMGHTFQFPSNSAMLDYLTNIWPKEPDYHPCYVPAFWLDFSPDTFIKNV